MKVKPNYTILTYTTKAGLSRNLIGRIIKETDKAFHIRLTYYDTTNSLARKGITTHRWIAKSLLTKISETKFEVKYKIPSWLGGPIFYRMRSIYYVRPWSNDSKVRNHGESLSNSLRS